MVPVGGKLWCGSQNRVLIINTTTLEQEVSEADVCQCRRVIIAQPHYEIGIIVLPSVTALVPGGHRQQSVRDLHGSLRSGCVVGLARQCTCQTVPCPELGEPDRSGRGTCRSQDACR